MTNELMDLLDEYFPMDEKQKQRRLKRINKWLDGMDGIRNRIKAMGSFHIIDHDTLEDTEDSIILSCKKGKYCTSLHGADMGDHEDFNTIIAILQRRVDDWEKELLEEKKEIEDGSI